MKICPRCNAQVADDTAFCPTCGMQLSGGAPEVNQVPPQQTYAAPQPAYDPYDHTAEFDPKDISDNKVISMLVYLLGAIGIIIALLASNTSPYAGFHVRQALKFTVIEILTALVGAIGSIICIGPFVAAIFLVVLAVVKIICFFQICQGKAVEPVIIRNFTFLK